MPCVESAWRATAAYLYLLALDNSDLAWEYLRRNAEYRRAWLERDSDVDFSARWGCAFAENPDVDARRGHPNWVSDSSAAVRVVCAESDNTYACRFDLWKVRGRKHLAHCGGSIALSVETAIRTTWLQLSRQLQNGDPCALAFVANAPAQPRRRALLAAVELLEGQRVAPRDTPRTTISRERLVHMRSLQAFDACAAGASHREIAEVFFGTSRVAESWTADSELRAQVRYLIRRATDRVAGGYRALLSVDAYSRDRTFHAQNLPEHAD